MRERIIDANLNRLAEGLRVIEDLCRFGLEDPALAGQLKALRHDVKRLRKALGGDLLSARDSIADVGRVRVKEPNRRIDALEILGASFGRAEESLRVLEELAKLSNGDTAHLAKAMRYQCYELERRIVALMDRKEKLKLLRGLYLVMTDPAAGYESLAEAAVQAKVGAIQLREKNWESGKLLATARRLREITRNTQTLLFINDRPDIAKLCEADGLHLGQDDMSIADARRIVGERMLIGKSTHNLKQLKAALAERPDYVAIGPVFATTSKAKPDPVLGLEKAAKMLAAVDRPAVAIGGITLDNLPSILHAGFRCYSLISQVGNAIKPAEIIRKFKKIERDHHM